MERPALPGSSFASLAVACAWAGRPEPPPPRRVLWGRRLFTRRSGPRFARPSASFESRCDAIVIRMKVIIDADGRLTIPQPICHQAGLEPGMAVEVEWRNGHVEIEPVAPSVELVQEGQ